VKEPEIPQATGWHARLILGYNSKTNECLYSDSWGAGHELKRMSVDDAWIMHQFSLLLVPSGSDFASQGSDKSR
jgi:hypothetical protein